MTYDFLQIRQTGRVLTVWLDNPPHNFLTIGMMKELGQLVEDLKDDGRIGAVVLTSALNGIFLTHSDVAELKQGAESVPMSMSPAMADKLLKTEAAVGWLPGSRFLAEKTPVAGVVQTNLYHEIMARMRSMNKVFIAAINGRALGGGHELTLACDLRVMVDGKADEDVLGQPEICIGLSPGMGATQMLARNLGPSRALELCLDARLLSPEEALDLGLVHRLSPADSLLEDTQAWAERLARRPASAVKAIKDAIYQGASRSFDEGMAMEKAGFVSCATQPTSRSAMLAYADEVVAMAEQGKGFNVPDMQAWLDGTAVDFHAGGENHHRHRQ